MRKRHTKKVRHRLALQAARAAAGLAHPVPRHPRRVVRSVAPDSRRRASPWARRPGGGARPPCRCRAGAPPLRQRRGGCGRGVGRGRAGDPPTAGRPAAGWRTSGRYRAGRARGRRAGSAAVGGPVNAAPGRALAGWSAPGVARGCPRLVRGCQATASCPPWARQRGAPCLPHPPPRGQSGVPQAWPAARRPHAGAGAPASTPAEERGPPPPRKVEGLFPARPSQPSRAAEPVKAMPCGWLEDSPALTEPAALPQ